MRRSRAASPDALANRRSFWRLRRSQGHGAASPVSAARDFRGIGEPGRAVAPRARVARVGSVASLRYPRRAKPARRSWGRFSTSRSSNRAAICSRHAQRADRGACRRSRPRAFAACRRTPGGLGQKLGPAVRPAPRPSAVPAIRIFQTTRRAPQRHVSPRPSPWWSSVVPASATDGAWLMVIDLQRQTLWMFGNTAPDPDPGQVFRQTRSRRAHHTFARQCPCRPSSERNATLGPAAGSTKQ